MFVLTDLPLAATMLLDRTSAGLDLSLNCVLDGTADVVAIILRLGNQRWQLFGLLSTGKDRYSKRKESRY